MAVVLRPRTGAARRFGGRCHGGLKTSALELFYGRGRVRIASLFGSRISTGTKVIVRFGASFFDSCLVLNSLLQYALAILAQALLPHRPLSESLRTPKMPHAFDADEQKFVQVHFGHFGSSAVLRTLGPVCREAHVSHTTIWRSVAVMFMHGDG